MVLVLLVACTDSSTVQENSAADKFQEIENWSSGNSNYQKTWPESFNIGVIPGRDEILKWDIDVRPDGKGLPKDAAGIVSNGSVLYASKCSSCHGKTGIEGPYDKLRSDSTGSNTIGNYWPYATTIFDYVRRAMPFNAPGSLSNQEVYDITAYLLYINGIIERDKIIDSESLVEINMPARDLYVDDDRKGGNEIK